MTVGTAQDARVTPREAADPVAEHDRAASRMIVALHRLGKTAVRYHADHEAHQRAVAEVCEAARDYGQVTGRNFSASFGARGIYAGRRLLRANRAVYASAAELRELLKAIDAAQITIGFDVPEDDLLQLSESFRAAQRDGVVPAGPRQSRIRFRAPRPSREFAELDALAADERALRVYALTVVAVRRLLEDVRAGVLAIGGRLRRVCRELPRACAGAGAAFLASTAGRRADDDAARAVNTAVLALACVRQLSDDPQLALDLVMAAVLLDAGRARVACIDPTGEARTGIDVPALRRVVALPFLGVDQLAELPAASAAVATALGRMTDTAFARTVMVYETLHLVHRADAPIYGGALQPAMLSRLLAWCRCVQIELADGDRPLGEVLAHLLSRAPAPEDRSVLRLVMAVLAEVEIHSLPPPRDLLSLADRDDDVMVLVGPEGMPAGTVPLASIPPAPRARTNATPPAAVPAVARESTSLRPCVRATLEGTLAKTPLVHVLAYTLDHGLTGSLSLQEPSRGQAAIYFDAGVPCKARTPELVSPLDQTLHRMGVLDEATLAHSLQAVARTKQLHGQYLVAQGLITQKQLDKALEQQMVNKVAYMYRFDGATRWAYYDDLDLLSDYGGASLTRCKPLPLIMMGARKFVSETAVEQVLVPLDGVELTLHADADPIYLGLGDDELAIVRALEQGGASLDALVQSNLADRDVVRRLVYALVLTRFIDLSAGTRAPIARR